MGVVGGGEMYHGGGDGWRRARWVVVAGWRVVSGEGGFGRFGVMVRGRSTLRIFKRGRVMSMVVDG